MISISQSSMSRIKKFHDLILLIFLVVNEILIIHGVVNGELQRFDHPIKADGSLSILVIGDWGRRGQYNQSLVARQMGIVAKKIDCDFIISVGDNFYDDGLTDENDQTFYESFTNIYTAPSLQKQWYNVLGNHDYRGDALSQLSSTLKQRDSRWFCLKSYILNTEIADFFFIDTTPFQDAYFTDPKDHVYDWRGVLPREQYLSTLLQELASALKESHGKWKIVIGHHTIKSASEHGNTQELVLKVLPILQANNVDLYVNGHDHCLQHISRSDSPLQFLTSGGGSKAWSGVYIWNKPEEMKFFYDGQGFLTLQITLSKLDINFYDVDGKVLYKWGKYV